MYLQSYVLTDSLLIFCIYTTTSDNFVLIPFFYFSYKVLKAPDLTTQVKLSDSANTSPNSVKMRKRPSKASLPHVIHSSRSSLHMFPIISGLVDKQNLEIGEYFWSRLKYYESTFLTVIFTFKSMEHCGMDHFSHAIAQILHWTDRGRQQHKKTICTRGWQNNIKSERNLLTKKMQRAL